MRRNPLLFYSVSLCLSILALGCENSARVVEQQGADAAADLAQPTIPEAKPNRILSDTHWYRGRVAAVDLDWVELAVGWEWVDSVEYEWGTKNVLRRKVYDNSKPKRFSVVRTRPGGNHDCEPFLPASVYEGTHRVVDLLVGDVVSISTGVTREGEEWPIQLLILRRLGRQIPPLHGDPNLGSPSAAHLALQAEQDWEEKGIPIPAKYLNKDGRYPSTKPPYPPEAPMPRVANATTTP